MKKVVYFNDEQANEVAATPSIHRLGEGDVLHVKILGTQENTYSLFNIESSANNIQTTTANLYMNGFTVNSDGLIEVPAIGQIAVGGLSIEEAKQKIQEQADEYVIGATVIVKHINFEITVLGEVNRPGTFTIYKNQTTLLEALGLAGDLTDYGNRKNVKIIRGAKIHTVDLTKSELLSSPLFYLQSQDVIYVDPRKNMRSRNSKAQMYFSAVSSFAIVANIVLNFLNN
jgi:polysaccharide export outer membrane protein